MTAWDADPALSEDDLGELLDMSRVHDASGNPPKTYDELEGGVDYVEGDIVVPAYADWNGYSYVCTEGGESADGAVSWPTNPGVTMSTGGASFVRDDAVSWVPTYDLNLAAAEGWRWKKAASAGRISFTADGATFNRDQFLAHCEAMIQTYTSGLAGSGRIRRHNE